MKSILKFSLVFSITLFLSGCFTTRPVETPIPTMFYDTDDGRNEELIIFLPGRGDDPGVFEEEKILETVHRNSDLITMDAHMGYYVSGLLAERVYEEVLLPYQDKGYRRFIIVGTSLGGYGALWVNHEYGSLISGLVLIAPYLGRKSLIKKIESSESLHSWRSQVDDDPSPGEFAWIWVDALAEAKSPKTKSIILAYGNKDGFGPAAELLAKALPEVTVFQSDGGHDWNTWRSLWVDIDASPNWENLLYTE